MNPYTRGTPVVSLGAALVTPLTAPAAARDASGGHLTGLERFPRTAWRASGHLLCLQEASVTSCR